MERVSVGQCLGFVEVVQLTEAGKCSREMFYLSEVLDAFLNVRRNYVYGAFE